MAAINKPLSTRNNANRNKHNQIRCMQINLQHSRVATANLMQLTEEESIDILSIQELYIIQNKVNGIPHKYRTYTIPNTQSRAAIVIANKQIDALLLKQLSETDAVVVEISTN